MGDAITGQLSMAAAERYERLFVPALFEQWPRRLLDAVGAGQGDRLLDVGCGTGVLAREAVDRVGVLGEVTGVDPNPGMLAVARRLSADATWLEGVAERLPVGSASVDVVACQFALMFCTDPVAAAQEMARVLRPGGRLVVATWADIASNAGYDALAGVVRDVAGDLAADALLAPFRLGRESVLQRLLGLAFPDVTIATHVGRARFPSLAAWLTTEVRAWTLDDLVTEEQYVEMVARAPTDLGRFRTPDGTVDFAVPALVATAST